MRMNPLGRTGLSVSRICLGTMTWGSQNSHDEAFAQMDYAVGQGVNIFDTAELYPTTPSSPETYGLTEEIVGGWLASRGGRDRIVLATKVAGGGRAWIDDGKPLSPAKVRTACERSLGRLRTDHIDLYQLHWPDRSTYHFRKSWTYDPSGDETTSLLASFEDLLGELGRLVEEGKVRHVGLCNETVWGTMQYLSIAERRGLPRLQSIQNEYSLLHRLFDLDFAELAHHEQVGLLAFSPLAAGILSGKYEGGRVPPGSRLSMQPDMNGRYQQRSIAALDDYVRLAREHGLDPAQMALAFALSRPFMTSVIIGATSMDQLRTNIAAEQLVLSPDVMAGIAAIHQRHPVPM